jgi:hypothetical protein
MAAEKRKPPSFTIRLSGKGVTPESIPIRTLSDAASAVMRLAIGQDDDQNNRVHVLGVQRGSAIYPCLMDSGEAAAKNLAIAGEVSASPDSDQLTQEMLRPFRTLSEIASKFEANVEIYLGKWSPKQEPIATIQAGTYKRIQGTAIIHDETIIHGYLVRVGGAEERRCSVRVASRNSLLYCNVRDEKLSRKLGQHLYEFVTLHGRGMFFARTWDLISLRVNDATFQSKSSTEDLIRRIRESGGDAWDDVVDVDAEVRAMR